MNQQDMSEEVCYVVNSWGIPFNVRLVEPGELLFPGTDNPTTHNYKETGIQFFDARYVKGFTPLGQFVSSYYLSTFIESDAGINLYGGVADWFITDTNKAEIKDWLSNRNVRNI
jgi:hypothetical protein